MSEQPEKALETKPDSSEDEAGLDVIETEEDSKGNIDPPPVKKPEDKDGNRENRHGKRAKGKNKGAGQSQPKPEQKAQPQKKQKTRKGGAGRPGGGGQVTLVEIGETRHGGRNLKLNLYTMVGKGTVENAIRPIMSWYMEITGLLASNKQGHLIGEVGRLVKEALEDAADFHKQVETRMDEAVQRHEQALGVIGTERARKPATTIEMVSAGVITPGLVKMVRGIDNAEYAKEQAVSVGAVEFHPAKDLISECIIRNRRAKNTMGGILRFIRKRLGGATKSKINVDDLKEYAAAAATERHNQEALATQQAAVEVGLGEDAATQAPQVDPQETVAPKQAPKKEGMDAKKKQEGGIRGSDLLARLTGKT